MHLDLPDVFEVIVGGAPGTVVPFSLYAEMYWLPVIGPGSFVVARRLVALAPAKVDMADLGRMVGLGHRGGANSPLARSMIRLVQYKLAAVDDGVYVIRAKWHRATPAMLERLPTSVAVREAAAAEAVAS